MVRDMNTGTYDSGAIDEVEDQIEDSQDLQESQAEQLEAAYPVVKPESNLYSLFWKVFKVNDSTKVANLKKEEIGNLGITVRDCHRLGLFGHLFGHPTFGDFFYNLGEITSSTSMSRDGWFSELFVSQKKFATRARRSTSMQQNADGKWQTIFGKKQSTQGEMLG